MIIMEKYIQNPQKYFSNIKNLKYSYKNSQPFPHIVFDNFFKEDILQTILDSFPDNLDKTGIGFNSKTEKKFSCNDSNLFTEKTNELINFLNSFQFLNFLNDVTDIKEKLIPDPYLIGGGFHELREGGHLNVHADFNKHPSLRLDRRLNILIYLNHNWDVKFGGNLELWDKNMQNRIKKISPVFNRVVIFSTTADSYHGNPEKICHPENISRKSIALYYYSNGRPLSEYKLGEHSTIFRRRPNTTEEDSNFEYKKIFKNIYLKKKI
tara:strand:+ start:110 stop:907 length:798 start_codon:yes stop_codon:yes gene_type:complete